MPYLKNKKFKKFCGKILVSGYGMLGVSSVIETLLSGKHTLNTPDSATISYLGIKREINDGVLYIIDLGCQKVFLESFIRDQVEFVFTQVSLLIFVIDITNVDDLPLAKYFLDEERKRLEEISPTAEVIVLLNKIDLVDKKLLNEVTTSITDYIFPEEQEKLGTPRPRCFPVSCVSGQEIFEAGDAIFSFLIHRVFPDFSLQAFKQELWSDENNQA
jgi:GTPase SAR1 family protein